MTQPTTANATANNTLSLSAAATATATSSMPATPLRLSLIVAHLHPSLGLGRAGQLPWPPGTLKADMAHFRRVTSTVLPSSPSLNGSTHAASEDVRNAVIMGRRTWESIPRRFRPLKGRWNVVVSGTLRGEQVEGASAVVASLEEALRWVEERRRSGQGQQDGEKEEEEEEEGEGEGSGGVAECFVIGGERLYAAALEHETCRKVYLTRVFGELECDVHFPVDLASEEAERRGWRRGKIEKMLLDESGATEGYDEKLDMKYVFEIWER